MPELIEAPSKFEGPGNLPVAVEEFVGRGTTGTSSISIARVSSPSGWSVPGQTAEFDEYFVVLGGLLVVEHTGGKLEAGAGQVLHNAPGE